MQHEERKEKAKARDGRDLEIVLLLVVILERVEHFAIREVREPQFSQNVSHEGKLGHKSNTHVMYGPSSL